MRIGMELKLTISYPARPCPRMSCLSPDDIMNIVSTMICIIRLLGLGPVVEAPAMVTDLNPLTMATGFQIILKVLLHRLHPVCLILMVMDGGIG